MCNDRFDDRDFDGCCSEGRSHFRKVIIEKDCCHRDERRFDDRCGCHRDRDDRCGCHRNRHCGGFRGFGFGCGCRRNRNRGCGCGCDFDF